MNRKDTEARLAELRAQREATAAELDQARDAVPQALIEGREPPATAPLTEMLAALDAAIARLDDSLQGHRDAEARAGRRRQVEKAMEAASERRKKAKRVDDALAELADAWTGYADAVRNGIGAVTAAGGDAAPLGRVVTTNRQSEALVRAVLAAPGGLDLLRALGVETAIRVRHGQTAAAAEDRVSLSLQAELARIKVGSPQPNMARLAQKELAELEEALG
jgi:hypothetical protein